MGSFGDAEVCELVRLYLLSKLSVLTGSDNGDLQSDNRLTVIHNAMARS